MMEERVDGIPVEHHALRVAGRVQVRAEEAIELRYGQRVVVVIDGIVDGIGYNDMKGETHKVGVIKPADCMITTGDWREALIERMGGDLDESPLAEPAVEPGPFGMDVEADETVPAGVDQETGEVLSFVPDGDGAEIEVEVPHGEVVGRVPGVPDPADDPRYVGATPAVAERETVASLGPVKDPMLQRFMETGNA